MKLSGKLQFFLAMIFLLGCAEHAKESVASEFCEQLHSFAEEVKIGDHRTVNFYTENEGEIFPTTVCKPSNMNDKSKAFCEWLSKNTSSEFMELNVSEAMQCLTGEKLFSKKKKVHISNLSGELTIHDPFSDIKNIDVHLKYSVRNKFEKPENSLLITVDGLDKN